ncbi:MAG: hypothetical protein JW891_11065 [Candidatus Lokiarchaeota archaeon]|nr:hypothetical protein [Candidatus Lokiarchaeota archaeon]
MNEKNLASNKISDILMEHNFSTYQFISDILRLDTKTVLSVLGFHLNISILFNYFPGIMREGFRINEDLEKFSAEAEQFYGFLLYIVLKFKSCDELTAFGTKKFMEQLIEDEKKVNLIEKFLQYNILDPEAPLDFIEELKLKVDFFPLHELSFDPLYAKMTQNRPFLFLKRFIFLPYIFDKNTEHLHEYVPREDLKMKFYRTYEHQRPPIFLNVSPELPSLYDLINQCTQNIGVPIFGNGDFIDDITKDLCDYYSHRIPSIQARIKQALICYAELLKVSEGRTFFKVQWSKIKETLARKIGNQDFVETFLSDLCLDNRHDVLPGFSEGFDAKEIVGGYHQFLFNGAYYRSGKIVSGCFWIWRALLKYLESLQREKAFRSMKGSLFENWVHSLTKGYFPCEKVILTNKDKDPLESHYYRSMKSTISDCPKTPIELQITFPEALNSWYFIETDITFRVKDYLFIVECKSTSVPRSKVPNVAWWMKNFVNILKKTQLKGELILLGLKNEEIDHAYLSGIKGCIPIMVNTEGLTGYSGLMNSLNYILYLGMLKSHVEKGEFDKFLKERVYETRDPDAFKDGNFSLNDILYNLILPIQRKIENDPELKKRVLRIFKRDPLEGD